jgi:hypothetical protein
VAITELSRYRMHTYFEETMGEEVASTLMEHLPPVGWADVATKQDLEHLATKADVAELRAEFHRVLRTHTLVLVGTMGALAGLMATALQLG